MSESSGAASNINASQNTSNITRSHSGLQSSSSYPVIPSGLQWHYITTKFSKNQLSESTSVNKHNNPFLE
jgi:hypothetical protein